jgi:replicative DNA helicase
MADTPNNWGPPPMGEQVRTPPHNDEAERSMLGAVFVDNRAVDEVSALVQPENLYREPHRHIFRAMLELHGRGEAIDVITLADYLSAEGLLDAVGGANALARLSHEVPSATNVSYYATIVKRKASLRAFIAAAHTLIDECYSDVSDFDGFMDRAEAELFAITRSGAQKSYATMREVIREAFAQIEALYQKAEQVTGVPSGFADLDEITAGWQPSDLIILAARPAMGKTAITLNMASHAALERQVPVAFFSLEMSNVQLALRMLCSESRVDQGKMRTGRLTEQEWARLLKGAKSLSESKIFLDDTPALPIMELRSKARQLKAEHDIGIIFVDYLQLMKAPGRNIGSREQEISEISRNLKGIAKELNVPVIALAQLNRGVEQRADKRPMNSDLRESGAIEQDADIISFIYRDEVYNPESEDKGLAEVILGKHRNGGLGTVKLRFFGQFTRFENLAPGDYSEP